MVQGRKREAALVKAWEKKYKVADLHRAAESRRGAARRSRPRSIVGATYFPAKLNAVFAKYMRDAGFDVRAMDGIDVPFDKVQELAAEQVYAHIKKSFLKHKGADAIYMLGSGWRTLNIIQTLEQDLQVPVVHPVTARVWEIQKRLHVREPRRGLRHTAGDHAMMRPRPLLIPIGMLGIALLASQPAAAQTVEQFYKGRTVTMLVGTAPGGINEFRRRLVARHLGRFIPGNPSFVVQNIRAAAAWSPPTGSTTTPRRTARWSPRWSAPCRNCRSRATATRSFDPVKFTWLGSLSSYADDAYLMLINTNHPAQTRADLKKPGVSVTLGADTRLRAI